MRILIAGDSLGLPRPHRINNYSFNEKSLAVSYEQTYASLLQHYFLQKYKFYPYIEVLNKSKRSQTMQGVYEELVDNLFFHEPDVFIIHVGIVDCWFREELGGKQYVPINKYSDYVERILNYFTYRPKCKVIFIGISPTSKKMEQRYPKINEEISKYNQILKNVCNNNIYFIDVELETNLDNIHNYLLPDDHHLNCAGNIMIFNKLQVLIECFIECNKGVYILTQQPNDYEYAHKHFVRAYEAFSNNTDVLYNLLITSYALDDKEYVDKVINQVNNNDFNDIELIQLVNEVKTITQASDND